jgi:hypothetical protein
MATKDQYDVYKAAYDEESARYDTLNDRMKTYLSVITLYSGLLIFKASDLPVASKNYNGAILFGLGSLAFVAALITFLVAGRVRDYQVAFSPADYIQELGDDEVVEDDAFYDKRIGEIAAAIEENGVQTDGIAQGLFVGSILLIVGIAFNLLYVATLLFAR